MKKPIQYLFTMMLLFGFLGADFAAAQQDVTIRDLNTYENLTSVDQIESHPLTGETVRLTAIISSNPKTSGLASFTEPTDPDAIGIGRIHVFMTDTTALQEGRDGMSMQIVQGSGTSEFLNVENFERGDVITMVGRLTFFSNVSQFVIDEIEANLGNARNDFDGLERFRPLLEPVVVSPLAFHTETGPNEVALDFDAYQIYNGMLIRIEQGTMANYSGDEERPNFTVNKDGVFTPLRDVSLRYRNDKNDNYRNGYNFRREAVDGDFIRPPIGSAVNVNGYLVINDFEEGYSFADGLGLFIAPMEDGVLWIDDETRLVNGESQNGEFEWPVDFEFIAAPPQVLTVDFDPPLDNGIYTPRSDNKHYRADGSSG